MNVSVISTEHGRPLASMCTCFRLNPTSAAISIALHPSAYIRRISAARSTPLVQRAREPLSSLGFRGRCCWSDCCSCSALLVSPKRCVVQEFPQFKAISSRSCRCLGISPRRFYVSARPTTSPLPPSAGSSFVRAKGWRCLSMLICCGRGPQNHGQCGAAPLHKCPGADRRSRR